jgi:hypothetical protein
MYVDGEIEQGRLFSICSQHLPSALLAVLACNTATVNVRAGQAHKLAFCVVIPTSATKTENPQALAYPHIYVDIDRNRFFWSYLYLFGDTLSIVV